MRCQARRANSESADSLCTRRNQTLAHSNWLLICAVALQVNVRGEIGEMLGQRKTAGDGGGAGPVTRVLVRQPNLIVVNSRPHAVQYFACVQQHCLSVLLCSHRLRWHVVAGYKCFQGFGGGGGG